MARAGDGKSFANLAASSAKFLITGGVYGVAVVATFGGGTVKLQRVGPDGSTLMSPSYENGLSTDFSANGSVVVSVPPGQYQFTVTTATAVYCEIVRCRGE